MLLKDNLNKQKRILIVNIINFNYLNLKNKHNEEVDYMDSSYFDGADVYGAALCAVFIYEKYD